VKYIGAHVSIQGGVETAPARAAELDANAMGVFTKNQRQWAAKPLTDEQCRLFASELTASGITPGHVVIHASYLINLATPAPDARRRSVEALVDECLRAEQLGLTLVNFHPGSGLGKLTEAETLTAIALGVKEVLGRTTTAIVVLESTAGQGDHVGWRFAHLRDIIDQANADPRVRVCVDTCHAYAAGYDLATADGYESMMSELEDTIGLDRLVAIHLNDSRFELGSRKDRHAPIGDGVIGTAGLAQVVTDPRLDEIPFVLETTEPERWADEIVLLRRIASGAQGASGTKRRAAR
jgi:deoxyribonuclease IV